MNVHRMSTDIAVDFTNKVFMNPYDSKIPKDLTKLKIAKSFCDQLI